LLPPPPFPPLYAILDPSQTDRPVLQLAEALAGAGLELMQLRDKQYSPREILEQAKQLSLSLAPRGVRFLLNDRADLAAMAGAGGVHVGQEDLPVEEARKTCPAPLWVGVSTHTLDQFRQAAATSADYIAVGPIFPTATKRNPDPVVGVEFIRAVRPLTAKPIVAIGGITLDRAAEVYAAGADSLAVIKDLIAAEDPAARAREYLAVAATSKDARP
jgi:thiamine-phosphate pyrophosphorylase